MHKYCNLKYWEDRNLRYFHISGLLQDLGTRLVFKTSSNIVYKGRQLVTAVRLFKVYFCALSDSLVGQQTFRRDARLRVPKRLTTTFRGASNAWAARRGPSCKAIRYPPRTKEQRLGLLDEGAEGSHRALASSPPGADYARFPCGCLKL